MTVRDEYLLYPDETYVGPVYPYAVPEVGPEAEIVHSPAGSVWKRVGQDEADAEQFGQAILTVTQSASAVGETANAAIPLDRLVPSGVGVEVGTGVLVELWNETMKADHADFLKVYSDLIEANQIKVDHLEAGFADGMVITGATVRTGAGYPRVELSEYGLRAFTSTGKLAAEIQGEESTFTGSSFRSGSGSSYTEMGPQGLRVVRDGETVFQAHTNSPTGVSVREPVTGKLLPMSSVVFGPYLAYQNSLVDYGTSFVTVLSHRFVAPSPQMFVRFEFDSSFSGHFSNSSGSWVYGYPIYEGCLRDEATGTTTVIWTNVTVSSWAPTVYMLYPHWVGTDVVSLVAGRTYTLFLRGRASAAAASTSDKASFGYARILMIPA